jgi:hypothetical protein
MTRLRGLSARALLMFCFSVGLEARAVNQRSWDDLQQLKAEQKISQ